MSWLVVVVLIVLVIPDNTYSGTGKVGLVDEEDKCDPKYSLMMERVDEVSAKVDEVAILVNNSLLGMTERLDRMSRSMMKMATVFRQLPEIMVQLKQQSKDCCSTGTNTETQNSSQEFERSKLEVLEDLTNQLNNSTNVLKLTTEDGVDVTSDNQTRSKSGGALDILDDLPYTTTKPILLLTTEQISMVTSTTEKTQEQDIKVQETTNIQLTNSSVTPPDAIKVQVIQLSNSSALETENAGCDPGFFRVGNECFRAFQTKSTWEAAREKCIDEGLRMAEPSDPVAVADYLKDNIAPFYYWLGGKGDGSTFRWLTGPHIAATSLYWFSQYPVSLFSNCLILLASHNFPTDVPFYAQPCDKNYYVLCQGADCCSEDDVSPKEVKDPRIITKGIITWVIPDEDPLIEETEVPDQHNVTSTLRNNTTRNDYIVRGCDSESFFIGEQCFVSYLDEKVNWELAQKKCASEGLILAQPNDPVALAFYLRHYVASSPFWLGADGDGITIRWLNGSIMEESSPLWYHSPSSRLNNCLMLLTNAYYQTPFYAEKCFAKFYTICQGNSSASDVIHKNDDAETFINLSTTEEPDNLSSTAKIPECNNDFFKVESGCYKSFTDAKQYTWDLAARKCEAEGLKLAEPENPVALASYLKNNVEPSYFWMGGSADGWTFRWVNGSVIPASSRLWYRYQPSAAVGNCLLLMATTSLTNLAPLYDNPCTDLHYAVCQMVF